MVRQSTMVFVVWALVGANVGHASSPVRAQASSGERVTVEIIGAPRGSGPQDPFGASVHLAAMCGSSWLVRNQRPSGRYLYRLFTAVNRLDDQDNYLRQAGCAYAVARAARHSGDPRYTVSAKRAIRALLRLTRWDRRKRRLSSIPQTLVGPKGRIASGHVLGAPNRFGGSALLLLAIGELEDPSEFAKEMVGLSRFLEGRQDAEGWFQVSDVRKSASRQSLFPGEALLALIRAYKHTKRDESLQAVMRALPWYRQYWRDPANRCTEYFAWQCSAFAEAYLITQDRTCVEYVCGLADWMLTLQYRPGKVPADWVGGFARYGRARVFAGKLVPGQIITRVPRNNTGSYAEGLADACRLAKAASDAARFRLYKQALVAAMKFLMGLQYTGTNSRHFAARYMPLIYGAVRESLFDGDVRCDYTQHATCAWLQYLMHLHEHADSPPAR